jgi:Flp pilus assembly protein TadG
MATTSLGGEELMRRGQALLELAVALSFLLLVLAGIADYGRALIVSVTLANAAREGAHYVARNPNDLAGARQLVRQEAANSGIPLSDADIQITLPSPLQPGQPVTVQVRTQVPTIMARFIGVNYLTVGAKATAPLLAAQ